MHAACPSALLSTRESVRLMPAKAARKGAVKERNFKINRSQTFASRLSGFGRISFYQNTM